MLQPRDEARKGQVATREGQQPCSDRVFGTAETAACAARAGWAVQESNAALPC